MTIKSMRVLIAVVVEIQYGEKETAAIVSTTLNFQLQVKIGSSLTTLKSESVLVHVRENGGEGYVRSVSTERRHEYIQYGQ